MAVSSEKKSHRSPAICIDFAIICRCVAKMRENAGKCAKMREDAMSIRVKRDNRGFALNRIVVEALSYAPLASSFRHSIILLLIKSISPVISRETFTPIRYSALFSRRRRESARDGFSWNNKQFRRNSSLSSFVSVLQFSNIYTFYFFFVNWFSVWQKNVFWSSDETSELDYKSWEKKNNWKKKKINDH